MQKQNSLNLGVKLIFLDIFRLKFEKTIGIFETSTLKFVNIHGFVKNKTFSRLGLKIPYVDILGFNFEKKAIIIFEISTLEFVEMQSFPKK